MGYWSKWWDGSVSTSPKKKIGKQDIKSSINHGISTGVIVEMAVQAVDAASTSVDVPPSSGIGIVLISVLGKVAFTLIRKWLTDYSVRIFQSQKNQ